MTPIDIEQTRQELERPPQDTIQFLSRRLDESRSLEADSTQEASWIDFSSR
jgi:hypothetical protein